MKKYVKSATNNGTKRSTLGMYIRQYLKDNYGYDIFDTWSYMGRAFKRSSRIAKLYYLGISYEDISDAVEDALSSDPAISRLLEDPYYKVDIFDRGIVEYSSKEDPTQGVLVQIAANPTIYIDKTTGKIVESQEM